MSLESPMLTAPLDTDDFHQGVSFAIEALSALLRIDNDGFSHDAATETFEGDVLAVLRNCLSARFGEAWKIACSPEMQPVEEEAPDVLVLQPCATYGWRMPDRVRHEVGAARSYFRSDLVIKKEDAAVQDEVRGLEFAAKLLEDSANAAARNQLGSRADYLAKECAFSNLARSLRLRIEDLKKAASDE